MRFRGRCVYTVAEIRGTLSIRIPKHSLNPLWIKHKTQPSIKINDMGIGKQGDIADVFVAEFANEILN
jgi:hypothetical protein